jgi:type VI secretion system secreted protein VgrG
MNKNFHISVRRILRSSALVMILTGAASAMALPLLGSSQNFAVLGGSSLTNTGATTVWGDIGIDPGTSITGSGSMTVTGTIHQTDGPAKQAQLDASAAWGLLAARAPTQDLTGLDLGGLTLTPGVYVFGSAAQLTGALTLDAGADPNAEFVFQIGSALTTSSGSVVTVQNGGTNVGVFWQIGSSATLGSGSRFAGNLLADQSITLNSSASILCGRVFALHAALTMDNNRLSNDCTGAGSLGSGRQDDGSLGYSAARPVPEPATGALLGLGLAAFAALALARRR